MSKIKKIDCDGCGKSKTKENFTLAWQKKNATCNYCRDFRYFDYRFNVHEVEVRDKEVKCLRCDNTFLGRNNVRICNPCKGIDNYKHDSYFTYNLTKAVSAKIE